MEKKKILIIDDDESIIELYTSFLENSGKYEVRAETSGTKALAAVKEFRPNLLILDILMPDVDGGEVACQMKADTETADIPIIFVSGAVTKEELVGLGTNQGEYPVIAKTVALKELEDAVERYIRETTPTMEEEGAAVTKEKKESSHVDRRKHKRINTSGFLSYLCFDEDDNPLEEGVGMTANISQGGLRLETNLPIEAENIRLRTSGINGELFSIRGKVVYTQMTESDMFSTGVHFRESEEKNRAFVAALIKVFNLQKDL